MDNLRDRIADAVWDEARTIGSTLSLKASKLIADAVIAALGLQRQDNDLDTEGPYRHRYVTEWTTG